ncbi:ADP-ribosylation factor-like protein 10 isoform 1-T2 [Amazona ochrocephala]
MSLSGALRALSLTVGAAVFALGSLLYIAWNIYFCDTTSSTDWDGWWEQDLWEQAPSKDAVRRGRTPAGNPGPSRVGRAQGRDLPGIPLQGSLLWDRALGSFLVPHFSSGTAKLGKGQGRGYPCAPQAGEGSGSPAESTQDLERGRRARIPAGILHQDSLEQLDWQQVLVLGLDGAGKSSVLHYICNQTARKHFTPTQGFNCTQLSIEGLEMELLEVGGSQNLRAYWPHYVSHAHVLVFVVDSVDRSRLATARQELHMLLAIEPQLPLVVLANKQDKSNAMSTAELWEELALHTLSEQRELFLLPTSATWDSLNTANSILHVKSLLVTLLSQTLSTLPQGEGSQTPPVQG